MVDRNFELEKEMQDKDNKYLDLYEENNLMHEDMLELQEQLEEAGFIGDGLSDDGFGDDNEKKKKISLGGKKVMSILKKTIKKQKDLKNKIVKEGKGLVKMTTKSKKNKESTAEREIEENKVVEAVIEKPEQTV